MQYGASTLLFIHRGLWKKDGFQQIKEAARKARYEGLQLVNLAGWDRSRVNPCDAAILSYEEGWGNELVFDMDVGLYYPNAIFSTHAFDDTTIQNVAVEIHPDLTAITWLYYNYHERGGKFCLDTLHLRRSHRKEKGQKIDWMTLLENLPASAFPLIHVHPQIKELPKYFRGQGPTCNMLRLLRQNKNIPSNAVVILEAFPLLPPPFDIWFARKLLDVTKSILEPEVMSKHVG